MLFQIARQYGGELFEMPDESGDPDMTYVCLLFNTLSLIRPWMERYTTYKKEIENADSIKEVKEKIMALENAENNYNIWIDMFPNQLDTLKAAEFQPFYNMLKAKWNLLFHFSLICYGTDQPFFIFMISAFLL